MWVEMNVGDVVRALGLNDPTKSYKAVRESAREAMRQFFEFEDTDGLRRMHHWISSAEYKQDTDTVRIRFAKEMALLIIDIKRDFSMLSIADYGKLQGRYAQRIYELIMAESGHEGRNRNRRGTGGCRLISIACASC